MFVRLCIINFVLLMMYLALSYLEWSKLLGLSLVAVVSWTPFRTQIWFGGTVPVIVDGLLWIDHWSFAMIMAIVVINLAVIWKGEHKST